MVAPVQITIPHRLGQQEAVRRLKSGFQSLRTGFSQFVSIEEESWTDNVLVLSLRALRQKGAARVTVLEREIHVEMLLPGLLGAIAGALVPAVRRQATLLLDKK